MHAQESRGQTWILNYVCLLSWKPRLSPLLALCAFLVCERHRGEASDWFPYVDVLPAAYTCPAYFTDDVMAVLPTSVRRRALEQRESVREIHSLNQDFFRRVWHADTVTSCSGYTRACADENTAHCVILFAECNTLNFCIWIKVFSALWSCMHINKRSLIAIYSWSRSLQPILNQPVEDVFTYEALRYAHICTTFH